MVQCLVTKLKGTVNNDSLPKIGELRIKFRKVSRPSVDSQYLNLSTVGTQSITIVGDGYFTDSTLSQNKGTTLSITGNNNIVYVSNTNCEVSIPNKYNITDLNLGNNSKKIFNKELDLDQLKCSPLNSINVPYVNLIGGLDDLKNITSLMSIIMQGSNVTGNISSLKNLTLLKTLNLSNTNVIGDLDNLKGITSLSSIILSNTNIAGDISSLSGLTLLNNLNLGNTNVIGDISSLQNLTSLASLNLGCVNTMITGNIDIFKSFTKLSNLVLKYSKLSGDIATLPSSCRFLSMQFDKGSSVTWSTRPSSAKIIAMEGDIKLSNLDAMLQNQANCQVGFISSDETAYKSIITLGTRTSAADDAVTTLQQKGYTVRIAKA